LTVGIARATREKELTTSSFDSFIVLLCWVMRLLPSRLKNG